MTLATPILTENQAEFVRRATELRAACRFVDVNDAASPGSTSQLVLAWGGQNVIIDASDSPIAPATLQAILAHFRDDLRRTDSDGRAIEGFNEQLSQSYEEIALIFRMARLLVNPSEPAAVFQEIADELRLTLGHRWLALIFASSTDVMGSLRGRVTASGELPCEVDVLQLAACARSSELTREVLRPGIDPLGTSAACEVLRANVQQDGIVIATLVTGGRQQTDTDITSNELQLSEAATNLLALYHQNAKRFVEERQQFIGTLHALSAAVDAKDPYTHGHSRRVSLLGSQLAAAAGLDRATCETVRIAGLLHDIGKIGVPESVLCKPGRLTDDEFGLIKRHPQIGYDILKDLPSLDAHLLGVLHHHERWDGRGYPAGLAGEAIPFIARILAIADTFDAMSSTRAYRPGLPRPRVLDEIRKSAGTQFDPQLVDAFLTIDLAPYDDSLLSDSRAANPVPQAA